jgi:glycine/D-amino acid oxidase-like deaminating enzyme
MSYWLTAAPYQDFHSRPHLPNHTQTVVIGGGLTGVSAAYWLRQFGVEVTLLEARGLSGGATGRNGGHIVSGAAVDFAEAVHRYGVDSALAIYQFTLDTISAIQTFITEHHIDCGFRLNGTVILTLHEDEIAGLDQSARQHLSHALPFEWWDAATCAERTHSASFKAGLFNPNAGQLWPAKLVFGVAEQALRCGADIYTNTSVLAVERDGSQLIVKTDRGLIRADSVVYATNAWTHHLIPELENVIVPVRGQVLVTEPAPPLWPFGLVTNRGYEYFTQRPDNRIVLGGMRWKSTTEELNNEDDSVLHPAVSAGLHEFLPIHFPALMDTKVEQEWTGIMAWTPDLNPLIGPLPNRPGEYIAAGYSGHGMPMTFRAGKLIAELIADKQPEYLLEAFSPKRFF